MLREANRQDRRSGTKLTAWVVFCAYLASCSGGSGNAIAPSKADKEEDSSETDDETADKSAPVSGAYLTCYVPEPKDQDQFMYGGCQVRDKKTNARVDLRKAKEKFTFTPPKGGKALPIKIIDLTKTKTDKYFDAIYRIDLPPKGQSLTGESPRTAVGRYFLDIIPMMMPKFSLLRTTNKKRTKIKGKAQSSSTTSPTTKTTLKGSLLTYDVGNQPQAGDDSSNLFNLTIGRMSERFVTTPDGMQIKSLASQGFGAADVMSVGTNFEANSALGEALTLPDFQFPPDDVDPAFAGEYSSMEGQSYSLAGEDQYYYTTASNQMCLQTCSVESSDVFVSGETGYYGDGTEFKYDDSAFTSAADGSSGESGGWTQADEDAWWADYYAYEAGTDSWYDTAQVDTSKPENMIAGNYTNTAPTQTTADPVITAGGPGATESGGSGQFYTPDGTDVSTIALTAEGAAQAKKPAAPGAKAPSTSQPKQD